jgi:hypothetical protein
MVLFSGLGKGHKSLFITDLNSKARRERNVLVSQLRVPRRVVSSTRAERTGSS